MQLLHPARDAHRPPGVAEVAAHFAHDGRHGEGHEVEAAGDVEAVDGVHQTQPRDLHQVVVGFTATVEAAGDVLGQR